MCHIVINNFNDYENNFKRKHGYSFIIDEDAYAELKRYLKSLELHYAVKKALQKFSDIELWISELFRTKLTSYKQVINIDDVKSVIAILGRPEDMSDDKGPRAGEKFTRPDYHRMYRDPDRRIIGGICAGIGSYWNVDPWIIRIIFVILAIIGGLGILISIHIVLPEAKPLPRRLK